MNELEIPMEIEAEDPIEFGISEVVNESSNNYEELNNLPSINGVQLKGDKTSEDLGIETVLSEDLTAAIDVGGIHAGDSYEAGTSLEDILYDLINPVLYPTFTNPTISLSASGSKLLEKGDSQNVAFTAVFSRGTISPAYGTSGFRSGEVSGYSLNGGSEQAENTWNIQVNESQLTYRATASYAEGEQPKDSKGNDYDSPLPSGSINSNIITYEFVNALWANISSISVVAKQPLISKSAKLKVFAFPDATVENPEIFDIPASWTVTAIEVLNTLSGQWENCESEFTVTDTAHDDAGGNSTNYKRYTCNLGYKMGSRQVRVKWS